MSMGQRMTAALLALKTENRLPPGIRTNELERRIADKLTELGCTRGELPSRRTFLRHVDRLRTLIQDTDGTDCHFRDDVADGMVEADDAEHEGDEEMEAEPRALMEITQAVRQWLLNVPHETPIDVALNPAYLRRLANMNIKPGDGIELRPVDMSWIAQLLVVSVTKATNTITTRLMLP